MNDWTAGYVADIDYTYGYYPEMNALRARFALLADGIACPTFEAACELGYGQGLSANIHAASTGTQWYGTDFNPAQAGMAQEMARASRASANLYDDSFMEFCTRGDLPDFDFIALHGIWSWISDENRQVIVDFIRRKLKVGGLVYVSYNTLPGWASFAPIRHLLTQHAGVLGAEGQGIIGRVNGAFDFAEKLLETKPKYVKAHNGVVDRLKQVKEQNRQYLAHEYFNRDWHPMYFSTMAEWLAPAKLDYACAASYTDQLDAINLTGEQQKFVAEIPDDLLRQSVKDFMVNRQFRRDFWIKGKRKLNITDRNDMLRAAQVVLVTPPADVPMTMTGSLGSASLSEKIYKPILDGLATHEIRTLGELQKTIAGTKVDFGQLVQAILVLMSSGHVMPAQEQSAASKARKQTDSLNAWLLAKARGDGEIAYLASPVTGGGIPMSRFEQLFLLSIKQGNKQPKAWVDAIWNLLVQQSQKIVKEGKVLETPAENLGELERLANNFIDKKLPMLKNLGIA